MTALRAAMEGRLKDADSAKYRKVQATSSGQAGSLKVLCGQVNAKNSYGGYVGFRTFFATYDGQEDLQKSLKAGEI